MLSISTEILKAVLWNMTFRFQDIIPQGAG